MIQDVPIRARWLMEATGKLKDYNQLMKPNLSGMVVFSSVIGYLLAPNVQFAWQNIHVISDIIILFIGGMLVTGSANTINQILEKDSDALMERTKLRPLPDGRMGKTEAWTFALISGIAGVSMLSLFFNLQSGLLSLTSLLLYAFAYTPMKKVHPIAVFIGAIPGALPPLIGWVAATGSFGINGWVLFLLQFFWQFPHFWAIAWVAFDDYNRAGIRMLPTKEKETRFTGLQCMTYSLVLIPMAIAPRFFGLTGNIGMWICLFCGILYFVASVVFYIKNDYKAAKRVMYASFFYLPTILLAIWGDKINF